MRYFVAILGAEGFGQDPQRTPIKVNHVNGPFDSLEEAETFAAERAGWGDEVLVLVALHSAPTRALDAELACVLAGEALGHPRSRP